MGAAALPAPSPEDPRPRVLRPTRELVGQTCLPGTALAADDEETPAASGGVLQRGQQLAELALASDQEPRGAAAGPEAGVARTHVEGGVLAQDRLLELLQRPARLDPELLRQRPPGVPVGLERVGLPAAAIEREHQLSPEPLAERMPRDQRLELAHEPRVHAEQQVGVDAILDRGQVQFLEPPDLRPGERLRGELGERRAAPERERRLRVAAREEAARLPGPLLEAGQVEVAGVELEQVAARTRPDHVCLRQRAAQAGDVHLQRLRGVGGRRLRPEQLDQAAGGDDVVRVQEQERQQRPLLSASELDLACGPLDLERSEDPELHRTATLARRARLLQPVRNRRAAVHSSCGQSTACDGRDERNTP